MAIKAKRKVKPCIYEQDAPPKGKGKYYANAEINGRRVRKTGFFRVSDAEAWLATQRMERPAMGVNTGLSWDDLGERLTYHFEAQASPSYLARINDSLAKLQEFHKGLPNHVDKADLIKYRTYLLKSGYAVATANTHLGHIRAAFSVACDLGLMRDNPAKGIKRLKEAEKEIRYISLAEYDALCEAVRTVPFMGKRKPEYVTKWLCRLHLGYYAGMRASEVEAFTLSDLGKGGKVAIRNKAGFTTKSKRNRTAYLSPTCLPDFKKLAKLSGPGLALQSKRLQHSFAAVVERAEIPHCTFHDLRRSCASRMSVLLMPMMLTRWLGWASITTGEKYYLNVEDVTIEDSQKFYAQEVEAKAAWVSWVSSWVSSKFELN